MALVSESCDVGYFNAVTRSGFDELTVKQNNDPSQPESLQIEADKDILALIHSEVRNETLLLKLDWDWWNPARWIGWLFKVKTLRYTVHMNRVSKQAMSGAGSVIGQGIKTEHCTFSVSGSGNLILARLAGIHMIRISGAGDVRYSGTPYSVKCIFR